MSLFDYRAKDHKGYELSGAVEAPSEEVAFNLLADRGLILLAIKERKQGSMLQSSLKIFNRVKTKDLVIFSRQLAVMVSATMPLVQSLRILVNQTQNENLSIIISDVAEEVEGGAKLSGALSKYPEVFNNFFVNMVKSGETSGKIDETFNYLADEQEKSYDLISKIRGAMIYPAFVVGGLGIVGIVMMVFVVPKLTAILQESGKELPFATKILIGTSNFMQHYWWLLLLLIIIMIIGIRIAMRTPAGRFVWDRLQLRLPIFGNIFNKIYLTRFTRSLATLLVGGVPLVHSLEIVAGVVGNAVYKDIIQRTIHEVEEGNSISTIFLDSPVIPSMVSQMLTVGEKTGKQEEILNRLTAFYTRELENLVANLVTLIEPLIMVVLGVGVGLMVAAIILPIYNSLGQG